MTKAAELAKMGEVLTNSQIGGRRNIVINGAMQVAQRSTSETGVFDASQYETLDRFKILGSTSGRATMTQTADGPSGFANCLKLDCTTADTSIAASEFGIIRYLIEGQDVQQLKKVTISFYVKGNANATYQLEFKDGDNDRINSQTFNVTTSWNRIVLTFDADTTGVLDDDNAASIQLNFWLHAGSTYTSGTHVSNTWAASVQGNRVNSSNTSFFDSTDRTFFLTGVQMEVGSVATPFEHRSIGDELALCQRYFYKTFPLGTAPAVHLNDAIYHFQEVYSSNDTVTNFSLPVDMRADPTVVFYPGASSSGGSAGDNSYYDGSWKNGGTTLLSTQSSSKNISWVMNGTSSMTLQQYNLTADSEL
jgi:hypothetical protein